MDFLDPTHPDVTGALLALLWAGAVALAVSLAYPKEGMSDETAMAFWFVY